jgi:hypothetical protein
LAPVLPDPIQAKPVNGSGIAAFGISAIEFFGQSRFTKSAAGLFIEKLRPITSAQPGDRLPVKALQGYALKNGVYSLQVGAGITLRLPVVECSFQFASCLAPLA